VNCSNQVYSEEWRWCWYWLFLGQTKNECIEDDGCENSKVLTTSVRNMTNDLISFGMEPTFLGGCWPCTHSGACWQWIGDICYML